MDLALRDVLHRNRTMKGSLSLLQGFAIAATAILPVFSVSASSAPEFAPDTAETYERVVVPFLDRHCYECHDELSAKAGLNLDELSTNFATGPELAPWLEIMDAINLGEMPPEEEPRPDPARAFEVVRWIAAQLSHAEKVARDAGGQIPMRRLNRDEFANTVQDLLQLDEAKLTTLVEDLPGDGKAEGFDRLGVALFFDQTQIQKTLEVAEAVAALSIVDPDAQPDVAKLRFEAEARRGGLGVRAPKVKERSTLVVDEKVYVDAGPPTHRFEETGVRFDQGYGNSGQMIGGVGLDDLIPEDGYYRVRIRAGGDPGTRGIPIAIQLVYNAKTPQEVKAELPIPYALDEPGEVETVLFLTRGSPDQRRRISLTYNALPKYFKTTPEYSELRRATIGTAGQIQKAKAAGDEAEAARLGKILAEARARAKRWKGPQRHINPEYAGQEPPRLFLDWLEFQGPLYEQWPPPSHQALLFDGDQRQDTAYVREVIGRFLPRAYRRPVSDKEVERVVEIVEEARESGANFHEAMRIGLQRILTSPSFLFLLEPSAEGSRQLTDFELASRLSYFLWSTMPDKELFDLAAAEKLSEPDVLRTQVQRLLDDTRSREFVENFAGQWLHVRDFGSVQPAENLYSDYDPLLESSGKEEVYAFFQEILKRNLPVTNFLDSEFVVINERLARHYGIKGVKGDEFRPVTLKPEHHRGGVFGMAGLMTLLSDGTRTLPVRRAAFVVENLFNDPPPPPPPNAGEVQPNTAGERLTVRQRLERHRDEPTCASCHATLDPFGIALENYDAIGKWRTHQNGENFRGKNVPELDVRGELPSGRSFATLEEFKAALLSEKDQFARALSERMLTYALGRPVGYSDRGTIQDFVNDLKASDYQIQTLIHAIVASEAFHTK